MNKKIVKLDEIRELEARNLFIIKHEADGGVLTAYDVDDSFFISALGARICYSDKNIEDLLLYDSYLTGDVYNRKAFLTKLAKKGHLSIFAHTPVVVTTYASLVIPPFKTFMIEGDDAYHCLFTARHVMEYTEPENRSFVHFRSEPIKYQTMRIIVNEITTHDGIPATITAYYLNIPFFGWLSVVIDRVSRVFSHQFVRHTWLNFNQRSHRYTKVDGLIIPPDATAEYKSVAPSIYTTIYKAVEGMNSKNELKRYLLPQGSRTTIMASGPIFAWEDFINKRKIPQAQEEIRIIAEGIEEILKSMGVL